MSEDNKKETNESELTPEQLEGVAGGALNAYSPAVKSPMGKLGGPKQMEVESRE